MRRRAFPVFRPRRRRGRLFVVAVGILGLLIIGAAILIGGGYWYLSGSLPDRDGTIHLTGLKGEVRVYWDERGTPHIEATRADDLFFVQGYVTAQDRLWQMDVYRRLAGGHLAEILGESELPQDMFFRTLGFRQAAEASIATADPEALMMAEAYAAGVTAYIEHVTGNRQLPVEFRLLGYEPEPWTVVDTLLIARLMAYQLSGNWADELNRYRIAETVGWDVLHQWLPDYPAVAPAITTWVADIAPEHESQTPDGQSNNPPTDEPPVVRSGTDEPRADVPRSSELIDNEPGADDPGPDESPSDEPDASGLSPVVSPSDEHDAVGPGPHEPRADGSDENELSPDESPSDQPDADGPGPEESSYEGSDASGLSPAASPSDERDADGPVLNDSASDEGDVDGLGKDADTDEPGVHEPDTNGPDVDDSSYDDDPVEPQPVFPSEEVQPSIPDMGPQPSDALTRFAPLPHLGSNSWALAPTKTATGGALLANDPHMQIGIPALWHQVHLVLEDDFQAIGISVPGIPGIVFGRNDRIAWAITSLVADSQDLFIQRPNPDNPREFLYKGQWEPATVREEVIHVKGRSEPVIYEVLETARHGPVLNPVLENDVADVLSIKWTALGPTREINALLPLMRATNFEEFEAAVDVFDMPALSLLYADVDGNIGYKASGLLPVRPSGGGRVPLPAWTGEHDWLGTIPKSDMPRSYNPEAGFIVTANNLPADGDYPYYLGDGFDPWRALRITEVLAEGDDFTVEDMRALQLDVVNVHAEHMLPMLVAAVETRMRGVLQPDPVESAALALLKQWNYAEDADRPEPFIWHMWLQELQRVIVRERLGFDVQEPLLLDHMLLAMSRAELEEVVVLAFRAAVRRGVAAQGDDPARWEWGRWHRLTVYHPVGESVPALGWLMNVGHWPMSGSGATPGVAGFDAATGLVNHGASWRTVVDLHAGVGRDVLLPGNSGHVLSPAYKDQAEAWYAGQLYDQQWRPEQYRRGVLLRLLPN